MCGRYYVDDETARDIEKLVKEVDAKLASEQKKRDIHPTETAPVICEGSAINLLGVRYQYWGFPSPQSSKHSSGNVIFNARSETISEKPMFADSLRNRRIIIPARGFYEWNSDKTKYAFVPSNDEILYMAGIYRKFEGKEHFVILTTKANDLMRPIHDRMPVLLKRERLPEWIFESSSAKKLLTLNEVKLDKQLDFEQLSFCFPEQ